MVDRFEAQARQIASMPPDTGRENAIRGLASEWAQGAAGTAEQWAARLEDPAERERALTHVCLEVAARDPRGAVPEAQPNRRDGGPPGSGGNRWAAADFDAAAAWAVDLPEGQMRDRVLMRLVQSRALSEPAEAASMLAEWPLSGRAEEEAAMSVLHQWLLKDPEAGRRWVELFPDGLLKERASDAVQGMSTRP